MHTPTPWVAMNHHPEEKVRAQITYIRKPGDDENSSEICMFFGSTRPEQAANIEFMLKAVNSHAALIEALLHLSKFDKGELSADYHKLIAAADAALKLAGVE